MFVSVLATVTIADLMPPDAGSNSIVKVVDSAAASDVSVGCVTVN